MESIGAHEAKTHFSQLLDRVEKGEHITIQRHGVPVAVLQPVDTLRRQRIRDAIAELEAFQQRHTLGDDLTIRQLIDEGRD